MIKTVIFDLGDVIVNVDKTEQFEKFAVKSNKSVPYLKKYFDNSYLRKAYGRGELSSRQFYCKTAKELNLKMGFNEFKKAWCNIFTLNKNVEKLVRDLKRNFKLVLLSNTDELHFEYIKNKFKIVNDFDEYVLSYIEGCMKPNPLIFWRAIKKSKTAPFNCVYLDDIYGFVFVARLMGVKAFQYKNFKKLVDDLNKVKVLTKVL